MFQDMFDTHVNTPSSAVQKRKQTYYPSNSVIQPGTTVQSGSRVGDSVIFMSDVHIGTGVAIGVNAQINSKVVAGSSLIIGAGAIIASEFSAGDRLYVGANSRIGANATIGEHATFSNNTVFAKDISIGAHATFGKGCVFQTHPRITYAGRRAHAILTLNDITGNACTFTVVPHTKGVYVEWGNRAGEADEVFSASDLIDDPVAVALGKAVISQVKEMLYSYKQNGGW